MHYPDRPKRGDPITAAGMNRTADAILAGRIRGGTHTTISQTVTGTRIVGTPPLPFTLAQTTTAATRTASPEWWYADAEEMYVHSDRKLYTRKPARKLRVISQIDLGPAGAIVLAWWDAASGWWVAIKTANTDDTSSGSGSGSDSGSGSGESVIPCGDCLAKLCVARDPYTGAITDIYYETSGGGYIQVPNCAGGTGSTGGSTSCGTCTYQWTGTSWVLIANNCTGGCSCSAPIGSGSFVGQQITTTCGNLSGE